MLFLALIFLSEFTVAKTSFAPVITDADLAVSNFSFSPQTIIAGANPGSVIFRLTNNGPAGLSFPNTRVDGVFYISRNSIFGDGDDIQIGINNYDFTLASGSFYNVDLSPVGLSQITIPESALGSYYVFVRVRHNTSSALTDPDPGNDTMMRTGPITVVSVKADLAASNLLFSPQTIPAGAIPTAVSFRLTNNGNADLSAPNTRVKGIFFISRNSTFGDADDIEIGNNSFDFTLASGLFTDVTLSAANLSDIKIPTNASGNYNLFVRVQHEIPSVLTDPVAGNDYTVLSGGIFVVNTNADLAVSNFSIFPQTMNAGTHPDSVSFVLSNNGPANLSSPNNRVDFLFYISRNSISGDGDDIQIGTNSSDYTLVSGTSADVAISLAGRSGITFPANASGSYFVFVRVRHNASSALTDPAPDNNYTMRSGTIFVVNSMADLAASDLLFLPDTVHAGTNPGTVSFRLTNNGPSDITAPNSLVDGIFYLSRNSIQGDADDFQIGIDSLDLTLASGTYTDVTVSAAARSGITIPANAYGRYFVFVRVRLNSSSDLIDPNAENNYARKLGTILVLNANADLAASDFAFLPETIDAGANPTDVLFRLTNNGPADLSSPDTRVNSLFYISRNNIPGDSDDILIGMNSSDYSLTSGSYTIINLNAAQRSGIKIPVGASGVYYIFVRVQHFSPSMLTDPIATNNYTVKTGIITVKNPYADLAASNFIFTPQSIQAGAHPDSVSFLLTNNGPADLISPNTRVDGVFYISRNNTYGDGDDIQLGINPYDYTLASGSDTSIVLSSSGRSGLTIPASATGSYYVFVRVMHKSPSILTDTIPANNLAIRAGTIHVINTSSDLAASNLSFMPQVIHAGSNPDTVSFRLTNNGPVDLSSPNTRVDGVFYISPNNIYGDVDDILIGTSNFDLSLASGSYADVTLSAISRSNLTIPVSALGSYYVFIRVMHKSPSVLTDPTPANDYTMRAGTINIIQPCNLSVLPANLNFSFSAGSKVLAVTSNYTWSVTDNADWITVTPVSGSSNGTLTVNVTENDGITRIGKIVVAGCGKSIGIDVQQDEFSALTIKKIQGETVVSPYVGTYQRILGTVTGVVPGKGYFVQDASTAWSGIWVADVLTFVLEGNGVKVDGTIQEIDDVTTLNAVKAQIVNPPVSITPILLSSPEVAKSEQYESVLVKIAGARFQGSQNLDGSWALKTTETNRVFVSNLMFEYAPFEGHYYNVTGIVNGYITNFRIEPRKAADIVDLTTTTPVVSFEMQDLGVYPNPFTDYLHVKNNNNLARLTITDMSGRMVLDVAHPQSVIKTAHFTRGIYIIRLYTDSGIFSAEKFIRE